MKTRTRLNNSAPEAKDLLNPSESCKRLKKTGKSKKVLSQDEPGDSSAQTQIAKTAPQFASPPDDADADYWMARALFYQEQMNFARAITV
ncbi:hypothetical protein R1flu_017233 [Riccia fluitans]|uniref:Uncharacterized protein n=1 Tax=Riccia fluitans TaxID=41844 RepID=A0ABD1XE86_9MARC